MEHDIRLLEQRGPDPGSKVALINGKGVNLLALLVVYGKFYHRSSHLAVFLPVRLALPRSGPTDDGGGDRGRAVTRRLSLSRPTGSGVQEPALKIPRGVIPQR